MTWQSNGESSKCVGLSRCLPLIWETPGSSRLLATASSISSHRGHLGSGPVERRSLYLCLSLSVTLPFKEIKYIFSPMDGCWDICISYQITWVQDPDPLLASSFLVTQILQSNSDGSNGCVPRLTHLTQAFTRPNSGCCTYLGSKTIR